MLNQVLEKLENAKKDRMKSNNNNDTFTAITPQCYRTEKKRYIISSSKNINENITYQNNKKTKKIIDDINIEDVGNDRIHNDNSMLNVTDNKIAMINKLQSKIVTPIRSTTSNQTDKTPPKFISHNKNKNIHPKIAQIVTPIKYHHHHLSSTKEEQPNINTIHTSCNIDIIISSSSSYEQYLHDRSINIHKSSDQSVLNLYFDGGIKPNPGPLGAAAYIIFDYKGKCIASNSILIDWNHRNGVFNKLTTNHEAEYIGLIHGLKAAATAIATATTTSITSTTAETKTTIKHIHVYGDSELVINQMNNIPQVLQKSLDNLILSRLHQQAVLHSNIFTSITFEWIPRYRNVLTDKLVKLVQISCCSSSSDNTITSTDDTIYSNCSTSSSYELLDNNNITTSTITTTTTNTYETTDWFLPFIKTACLMYSTVVRPSSERK